MPVIRGIAEKLIAELDDDQRKLKELIGLAPDYPMSIQRSQLVAFNRAEEGARREPPTESQPD